MRNLKRTRKNEGKKLSSLVVNGYVTAGINIAEDCMPI